MSRPELSPENMPTGQVCPAHKGPKKDHAKPEKEPTELVTATAKEKAQADQQRHWPGRFNQPRVSERCLGQVHRGWRISVMGHSLASATVTRKPDQFTEITFPLDRLTSSATIPETNTSTKSIERWARLDGTTRSEQRDPSPQPSPLRKGRGRPMPPAPTGTSCRYHRRQRVV